MIISVKEQIKGIFITLDKSPVALPPDLFGAWGSIPRVFQCNINAFYHFIDYDTGSGFELGFF